MKHASDQMPDAIDDLYRVFAAYSLPAYTSPCPCCHSDEEEVKLHTKPLRQLEEGDFLAYLGDALLTWGDVGTFKHLLPRIYELYAAKREPDWLTYDPEVVFGKFRHGRWREWPEAEQTAVMHYLHAFWAKLLGDPPEREEAISMDSWLCAIAQAEDDLSSYLAAWVADEREAACSALSWFLFSGPVLVADGRDRSPFWKGREEQYGQVMRWATSPPVQRKLQTMIAVEPDAATKAFYEATLDGLHGSS